MIQNRQEILQKRILENIKNSDDAFYLTDIEKVIERHKLWTQHLPFVTPFYAVKCNSNPKLIKKLIEMGINFDCATKNEIDLVLRLGADPKRIIFAHTCKQISHLEFAKEKGVLMTTFDNDEEIYKIKKYHPDAKLILRIYVDDSHSLGKLATKFGVKKNLTNYLLKICKYLDINVIGVSFHVGSNCASSIPYVDAIKTAREVFDEAEEIGYNFEILDLGGGFPGREGKNDLFFDICNTIDTSLKEYFSGLTGIKICAEPGRFYAMQYYTLCCSIIAKRKNIDETTGQIIYGYTLNAGVFSSFLAHKLGAEYLSMPDFVIKIEEEYKLVKQAELESGVILQNSILWGPTCASLDIITDNILLPDLNIGDWLIFYECGSYTETLSCTFNGFPIPKPIE